MNEVVISSVVPYILYSDFPPSYFDVVWNEVSLFKCYPGDIYHLAKFDNFKDEKISDYKTVSVSQSKDLLE